MNIRGLAVAGCSYPCNPTSPAVATVVRWASRLALSSMGIGGLGHLGVQFAVTMGFKTVAIARGTDTELLARKLGAWRYIDSQAQNPAEELITPGGATVILATSTSGKAFAAVLGGLGIDGKMIILLVVPIRIFPEPSPTVGESRERVPSEVQ
jgi:D-arabinose 1-dehydrogenase-like Zn-dependent alcohol dehydrogenase